MDKEDYVAQVARFTSMYPKDNPDSYIVGFVVRCLINKRSIYKEIRIFYKELKSQNDDDKIIQIAWDKLKPQFKTWSFENKKKKAIIGMEFVPKFD